MGEVPWVSALEEREKLMELSGDSNAISFSNKNYFSQKHSFLPSSPSPVPASPIGLSLVLYLPLSNREQRSE